MKNSNLATYGFYLVASLTVISMKFWFNGVESEAVDFLLWPTNFCVELITGSKAQYLTGIGYYHHHLNIVINKACSGFNFMVVSFMMISAIGKKKLSHQYAYMLLPVSVLIAYPVTLIANTSRIVLSILLESQRLQMERPTWFHQAEGIFTYLFFLVAIYFIVDFILTNSKTRYAQAS